MSVHFARILRLVQIAAVVCMAIVATPVKGQPRFAREFYQDFRGKKPLADELKMIGPDRNEVATPEEGGLRLTLPKSRKSNQPTGVRLMFPLAGDFELTGGYEIVSMEKPAGGVGVGVAFNLIAKNDYRKFAKLGRFLHPKEGNVYVAECWLKDQPNDNPYLSVPTTASTGNLRMVREGSKIRCFVADNPPDSFREIYHADFTAEELEIVRLGVNTNGVAAGVDIRLLDWRIRYGPEGAIAEKEPRAVPAAADGDLPSRGRLALILSLGIGALILVAAALGVWLYLRTQRIRETQAAGDLKSRATPKRA